MPSARAYEQYRIMSNYSANSNISLKKMLKKIATSLRRYSSIKFSTLTQKVQVKCSRHRENRKIEIQQQQQRQRPFNGL